ncbi:alpha/beta hydrolase family esterase [Thalassoglobus sp.]|uniref:alpha/beta hydrolase family esterase n=1 Tax=Thalassoglobus sp. TaxID=2795869 RepID=UPI003AA8C556
MKLFPTLFVMVVILQFSSTSAAQRRVFGEPALRKFDIKVDDLDREYLLHIPEEKETPRPVVFGFHGHGGTARNAARSFKLHVHWPDAIVVYMQGIPTPGKLTDPEGKRNGWQHGAGSEEDRDLKFFDKVLAQIEEKFSVDKSRIYSTGHSNGGAFTYLLWAERGDIFAAMAPSAAAAGQVRNSLTPKPVMHLAGEKDNLVKYSWQQATMNGLRKLNECEPTGKEWSPYGTLYTSKIKTPVVTYIHPGAHKYPSEAPPLIIKFFKEHRLPQKPETPAAPDQ